MKLSELNQRISNARIAGKVKSDISKKDLQEQKLFYETNIDNLTKELWKGYVKLEDVLSFIDNIAYIDKRTIWIKESLTRRIQALTQNHRSLDIKPSNSVGGNPRGQTEPSPDNGTKPETNNSPMSAGDDALTSVRTTATGIVRSKASIPNWAICKPETLSDSNNQGNEICECGHDHITRDDGTRNNKTRICWRVGCKCTKFKPQKEKNENNKI